MTVGWNKLFSHSYLCMSPSCSLAPSLARWVNICNSILEREQRSNVPSRQWCSSRLRIEVKPASCPRLKDIYPPTSASTSTKSRQRGLCVDTHSVYLLSKNLTLVIVHGSGPPETFGGRVLTFWGNETTWERKQQTLAIFN